MSIRFQADNDLKFAIVKGVRRREPAIDFASAREAELEGVSDPEVLERAASDDRVLAPDHAQALPQPPFMIAGCFQRA